MAPALSSPAAQRLSKRMYQALSTLHYTLLPSADPPLGALGECCTLLTFTHLTLGLLLPAVALAAMEVRLFERHQRQRRQLGLPVERGWHARLYSAMAVLLELDALAWGVATWMALGLAFDVAVLSSRPPQPSQPVAASGSA